MRFAKLFACGLVVSLAACSASAVVRVVVKNGKKVIYNDGIAEESATRTAAPPPSWSAAQLAAPSRFDDLIGAAATQFGLDSKFLKSVMLFESGFNPLAVSRKGARGLMQLMPQTAKQHGVRNVHDPKQNVLAGAQHLANLLDLYGGDLEKTLAAYNAGEAAVERYGGIPPYDETRDYVRNILAAYQGRSDLRGGFGRPAERAFRSAGRPVKVMRDANDRIVLTTGPTAPRPVS